MRTFEPVEFPVLVKGKWLTATVIKEIEHPAKNTYWVSFSDGFEDEFAVSDEEVLPEGTSSKANAYEIALANDLSLVAFINGHRYHIFQDTIHGSFSNIWAIEKDPEPGFTTFEIYYRGQYRFDVFRSEGRTTWQHTTKRATKSIVPESIVARVKKLLDTIA